MNSKAMKMFATCAPQSIATSASLVNKNHTHTCSYWLGGRRGRD